MSNQTEIFEPLEPHVMAGRLKNKKAIQDFIFAGNATFTIRNNNTGRRFTFRVKADKNHAGKWWVENLRGPGVFTPMGVIMGNSKGYHLPWEHKRKLDAAVQEHLATQKKLPQAKRTAFDQKAWEKENTPLSMRSFMWFLDVYKSGKEFSDNIEIWHDGICGRCGRTLTVPSSVERGFGDECAKWIDKEDRQEGLKL